MGDAAFTSRMAEDLVSYLGRALEGDMGLRSSCGAQLDAIAASARSDLRAAPAWDGRSKPPDQTITCRPTRSGASEASTEMTEAALDAAKLYGRVKGALERLSLAHARALADWYTPRLPQSPEGLQSLGEARVAIARALGHGTVLPGLSAARGLVLVATTGPAPGTPPEHRQAIQARRREAKAEIAALTRQAKKLLGAAREAYAEAWADTVRAERMERARRIVGGGA